MPQNNPFIDSIEFLLDRVDDFSRYPYCIPAFKFDQIILHPHVTFFIGENGTGKSTLLEAIAVVAGFNPEGGTRNFNFATRESDSNLCECIRLSRRQRRVSQSDGFFFRAESFFNVATEIERLGVGGAYGEKSLHEQSHGEAFLSLILNRFQGDGLYILDEPEAALSPQRQLSFLSMVHELVKKGSQFLIATHSPIIMGYPDAIIYSFSEKGVSPVEYTSTEHYKVTRSFLERRNQMLNHLFDDDV